MRLGLALTLLLCMCLAGCIGVTRMPERTHGQQGATQKIDLSFLKAGETSRAEVQEKLKPVDTGIMSEHFFVGRWDTSRWGAWAVFAGYGGATGGAGRLWRDANLLVEFDDQGTVKRYEIFPDKLFAVKLDPVVRETTLKTENRIDAQVNFDARGYSPANLVLSPDALEFTEVPQTKKPFHFRIPRELLAKTTMFLVSSNDAVHVVEVLRFSTNLRSYAGPRGKLISVQTTIPQAVTLLRYAAQPVHDATKGTQE
jgi:hypothetical protein